MGAGKKVYTYVSFSSQNNSNFMGVKILQIITTIKFLKNKLVQRPPFRHWSEMKGLGTGGEKMVTSGEVLSLATPEMLPWQNFDFYGSIDRWKMYLKQLWTLRWWVTLTHIPSLNLIVHILLYKYLYIFYKYLFGHTVWLYTV